MRYGTIVVGAGLSGLLVARVCRDRGESVVVLEKSRGVGGRLATKRVGNAVFDQGAQFFTVRDPRFAGLVAEWKSCGVAVEWPDGPAGRWIGRSGMTAIAKHLAEGIDVRREHRVASIERHGGGGWELAIDGQEGLSSDTLVVSAPLPQALALLAAGGVGLPSGLAEELGAVGYHPCLALLVVLDGPSQVPAEGVALKEGSLRWVADNVAKGVSPGARAAVTLHSSAAFAREHYDRDEPGVAARLLLEARPWLGDAEVVSATLHRWTFSEPQATFREPCLWLPELRLGLCGDAFGGPRVEGAAVSGMALGKRMA